MITSSAFIAKPLEGFDVQQWNDIAEEHGTIFDTIQWTDVFGSSLKRVGLYDAGEHLVGGFCYYEQRKCGLRILRNPPYTRQIGPFYKSRSKNTSARTNEQRAIVESMADYLSKRNAAVVSLGLSYGITDCLPFFWRKWKVVPRYTYRLDLQTSVETLHAGLSKTTRRHLKEAEKDGLRLEVMKKTDMLLPLLEATFSRQNKPLPQFTHEILASFPPQNNSYGVCTLKNDTVLTARYAVHDGSTAYALMSGHPDTGMHKSAGVLATWQTILEAKRTECEVFDFEGSVIPSVERYYRGFGGTLTPLFSVHRAWLPIEIALKTVRRQIF